MSGRSRGFLMFAGSFFVAPICQALWTKMAQLKLPSIFAKNLKDQGWVHPWKRCADLSLAASRSDTCSEEQEKGGARSR